METHELANILLTMPNETIFVQDVNGSLWNIKNVELCNCGCEVIISHEDY